MNVVDARAQIETYGQDVAADACASCGGSQLDYIGHKCASCGAEWPVLPLSQVDTDRLTKLRDQCRRDVQSGRDRIAELKKLKGGKLTLGTPEEWEATEGQRDIDRCERLALAISHELSKRQFGE